MKSPNRGVLQTARPNTTQELHDSIWDLANDYDKIVLPLSRDVDQLIKLTRRQVERGNEVNEEVLYCVNLLAERRGEEPIR